MQLRHISFQGVTPTHKPASPRILRGVVPVQQARRVVIFHAENPYHDRDYGSSAGTLGGHKDAGAQNRDKQQQYDAQQERLEWRRKNQHPGVEGTGVDRKEEPHINNPPAGDDVSERRGPAVPEPTKGRGDDLASPDNAIGNFVRKIIGADKKE